VINDAHCHFFSSRFLELLTKDDGRFAGADRAAAVASTLGWDAPGSPEALADCWVAEMDRHRVARIALIASVVGDEDSVGTAVARHPERFVGFFMFNPVPPEPAARVSRVLEGGQFRAVALFPAMHRYRLDDGAVDQVFQVASTHRAVLFVHCGVLSVGVRKKLGLPSAFDLTLGDPLAVAAVAARYPDVPVIIPHFGAGLFREALMAADQCPNVYLDSSSSNSWMRYHPGLSLTAVFEQALSVVGPQRLLFGTDSSFFPRGWQRSIYDAQAAALDSVGADDAFRAAIFAGNFDRLFPRAK
jgi:predicted TIM-barrel fold metal-dependent hydrolase